MIVVSGTMRSGTSMWMQILVGAGFSVIGEAFPRDWSDTLRPANPRGFFESQLLAGINYSTNPHPETGAYLFPEQTRRHAVKVFIPGLVRSDVAFLDHVLVTVRPWRVVAESIERMRRLSPDETATLLPDGISADLLWWTDTFSAIRDIAIRRYPAHVVSYDALVDDPEREISGVLDWLGAGELKPALGAVTPRLRRSRGELPVETTLEPEHLALMDELYEHLHTRRPLADAFVARLNQADLAIRPRLLHHRQRLREQIIAGASTTPARGS